MEKLTNLINDALQELNLEVASITYKKAKPNVLEIMLDTKIDRIIDIDLIVEATHIINPIVEENYERKESYVLDISSVERK